MLSGRTSIIDGVVTHPLSEQRANELYLRLDCLKPMIAPLDHISKFCYVKVKDNQADYRVRKSTGEPFSVFGYVESADMMYVGIPSKPMALQGSPTDITYAGNIYLMANKILSTLLATLDLPNTRPATPWAGCVHYDPTTDTLEIYDGTEWKPH